MRLNPILVTLAAGLLGLWCFSRFGGHDVVVTNVGGDDLVRAARSQIGVTLTYDPRYVEISYPNGDVPRSTGVCSDVVIRALRDACGIDLQQLVHEDMLFHFAAYPIKSCIAGVDASIDHRRVVNLEVLMGRAGWSVIGIQEDVLPGDILTCRIASEVPHIVMATGLQTVDRRPIVIHNIGRGVMEEPLDPSCCVTGHYRITRNRKADGDSPLVL